MMTEQEYNDLAEQFLGIIPRIEGKLEERRISSRLPVPSMPRELKGIVVMGPYDDPLPPDDCTEMDGLTLGKLASYVNAWASYLSAEVTRAKEDYEVYDDFYKTLEDALTLDYRDEGVAATLAKTYARRDPRARALRCDLKVYKGVYRTAADRYERYYQTSKMLSREQTRRGQEQEMSGYSERVTRDPSREFFR